jgi:hypothetical protein
MLAALQAIALVLGIYLVLHRGREGRTVDKPDDRVE